MKWVESRKDKRESLDDNWCNAFYKTGFINENLFKNDSLDILPHFIESLKQTSSTAFDYILMAYKEMPIDEHVVKQIELERYYNKINNSKKTASLGVSVNPSFRRFKLVRMVFILNPSMMGEAKRSVAIKNAKADIQKKNGALDGYDWINEEALEFLNSFQFKASTADKSAFKDANLLIQPRDYIVPVLKYGSHYEIDGVKRYAQYTEAYHYARNSSNELAFVYKNKVSGITSPTYEGYFGIGIRNGKRIYYIRLRGKLFNIFTLFKAPVSNKMFEDLKRRNSNTLMLEIVNNTYLDYQGYLQERTDGLIYETVMERPLNKSGKVDIPVNSIPISARDVINLVESNHQAVIKYTPYGDIASSLLKTNAISDSKSMRNDRQVGSLLRGEQISISVKSNELLTVSDQSSNPLDVFLQLSYRKSLSGKCVAENVKTADRFIDEDTYHLIDPITSRSEKSVGISCNLNIHISDDHLEIKRSVDSKWKEKR